MNDQIASRRRWLQNTLLGGTALVAGSNLKFYLPEYPRVIGSDILQLNWNENPYGPSALTLEAIRESSTQVNRYPDEKADFLKSALAQKHKLSKAHFLFTAGSTEVLSLLGQSIAALKGEIISPWPSFPTMLFYGERHGATIKKVALDEHDRLDLTVVRNAISENTKLVFLCNPNNPTSTEITLKEIESFCESIASNIIICVDEAYIEYSLQGAVNSAISLTEKFNNLLVCRTFSKAYGMAGLRFGYACAHPTLITELANLHTGLEMSNSIAVINAALTAINDDKHINYCVNQNKIGREILYQSLDKWNVSYRKSSTNFVYIEDRFFKDRLVERLQKENILITKWPDMKKHVRVSIGKPDEMTQFTKHLESHLI